MLNSVYSDSDKLFGVPIILNIVTRCRYYRHPARFQEKNKLTSKLLSAPCKQSEKR